MKLFKLFFKALSSLDIILHSLSFGLSDIHYSAAKCFKFGLGSIKKFGCFACHGFPLVLIFLAFSLCGESPYLSTTYSHIEGNEVIIQCPDNYAIKIDHSIYIKCEDYDKYMDSKAKGVILNQLHMRYNYELRH